MTPHNKTAAAKRTKASSVPGEESVYAASAFVTPMTLAKCGGNTVNVMTSPVCGTKARCAQVNLNECEDVTLPHSFFFFLNNIHISTWKFWLVSKQYATSSNSHNLAA